MGGKSRPHQDFFLTCLFYFVLHEFYTSVNIVLCVQGVRYYWMLFSYVLSSVLFFRFLLSPMGIGEGVVPSFYDARGGGLDDWEGYDHYLYMILRQLPTTFCFAFFL